MLLTLSLYGLSPIKLLAWLLHPGCDEAGGQELLSSQGLFCFRDPLCHSHHDPAHHFSHSLIEAVTL